MTDSQKSPIARPAVRGTLIGAASALIAFSGTYVALAATQAGIEQAQAPAANKTTQPGIETAQQQPQVKQASTPEAKPVVQRRSAPAKQPGLAESAREVKKDKDKDKGKDKPDDRRVLSSNAAENAPATERQPDPVSAPVQQAPSYPVQQAPSYPVQQAPSYPVQQAPAPAPAPVQQAPAPAPAPAPQEIVIDLGGRAPVVPQAPIAPKQLHVG